MTPFPRISGFPSASCSICPISSVFAYLIYSFLWWNVSLSWFLRMGPRDTSLLRRCMSFPFIDSFTWLWNFMPSAIFPLKSEGIALVSFSFSCCCQEVQCQSDSRSFVWKFLFFSSLSLCTLTIFSRCLVVLHFLRRCLGEFIIKHCVGNTVGNLFKLENQASHFWEIFLNY